MFFCLLLAMCGDRLVWVASQLLGLMLLTHSASLCRLRQKALKFTVEIRLSVSQQPSYILIAHHLFHLVLTLTEKTSCSPSLVGDSGVCRCLSALHLKCCFSGNQLSFLSKALQDQMSTLLWRSSHSPAECQRNTRPSLLVEMQYGRI